MDQALQWPSTTDKIDNSSNLDHIFIILRILVGWAPWAHPTKILKIRISLIFFYLH